MTFEGTQYNFLPFPYHQLGQLAAAHMDSIKHLEIDDMLWNTTIGPRVCNALDRSTPIQPGRGFDAAWRYFRGLDTLILISQDQQRTRSLSSTRYLSASVAEDCREAVTKSFEKLKSADPLCKVPKVIIIPREEIVQVIPKPQPRLASSPRLHSEIPDGGMTKAEYKELVYKGVREKMAEARALEEEAVRLGIKKRLSIEFTEEVEAYQVLHEEIAYLFRN
jgi:hypothetical protein